MSLALIYRTKEDLMEEGVLVDAAVVAMQLGMAKSSVYRLAKSGAIISYACGPKLSGRRFDIAEVRAQLKALAAQAVTK